MGFLDTLSGYVSTIGNYLGFGSDSYASSLYGGQTTQQPAPSTSPTPSSTTSGSTAPTSIDYSQYYKIPTASGYDIYNAQTNQKYTYDQLLPYFQSGLNASQIQVKNPFTLNTNYTPSTQPLVPYSNVTDASKISQSSFGGPGSTTGFSSPTAYGSGLYPYASNPQYSFNPYQNTGPYQPYVQQQQTYQPPTSPQYTPPTSSYYPGAQGLSVPWNSPQTAAGSFQQSGPISEQAANEAQVLGPQSAPASASSSSGNFGLATRSGGFSLPSLPTNADLEAKKATLLRRATGIAPQPPGSKFSLPSYTPPTTNEPMVPASNVTGASQVSQPSYPGPILTADQMAAAGIKAPTPTPQPASQEQVSGQEVASSPISSVFNNVGTQSSYEKQVFDAVSNKLAANNAANQAANNQIPPDQISPVTGLAYTQEDYQFQFPDYQKEIAAIDAALATYKGMSLNGQEVLQGLQKSSGLVDLNTELRKIRDDAALINNTFEELRDEVRNDPNFSKTLKSRRMDFIDDKNRRALVLYQGKEKNILDEISQTEKLVSDQYGAWKDTVTLNISERNTLLDQRDKILNRMDKASDNARQAMNALISNPQLLKGVSQSQLNRELDYISKTGMYPTSMLQRLSTSAGMEIAGVARFQTTNGTSTLIGYTKDGQYVTIGTFSDVQSPGSNGNTFNGQAYDTYKDITQSDNSVVRYYIANGNVIGSTHIDSGGIKLSPTQAKTAFTSWLASEAGKMSAETIKTMAAQAGVTLDATTIDQYDKAHSWTTEQQPTQSYDQYVSQIYGSQYSGSSTSTGGTSSLGSSIDQALQSGTSAGDLIYYLLQHPDLGVSQQILQYQSQQWTPEQILQSLKASSTSTSSSGSATGMRTDRNNNPTAFTTDIARLAGLVEGRDYVQGDPFANGQYYTARLLGDPVATTINVIDRIGFQTSTGQPRWNYINIPKYQWDQFSYDQKRNIVAQMYQQEGGTQLGQYFV